MSFHKIKQKKDYTFTLFGCMLIAIFTLAIASIGGVIYAILWAIMNVDVLIGLINQITVFSGGA